MRITVNANMKGGVGKTTVSVNTAAELARRGRRVLLLDADPDKCATDALGIVAARRTMLDVLTEPAEGLAGAATAYTRIPLAGQLDVVAGHDEVTTAPRRFADTAGRQPVPQFSEVIAYLVRHHAQHYDHVIIDPSPSWDALIDAALFAADQVIVPIAAEAMPTKAAQNMLRRLERIREQRRTLRLPGQLAAPCIVINKVLPDQEAMAARIYATLDKAGIAHVPYTIPYATAVWEAPAAALPVWAYAPDAPVVARLAQLADLVEGGLQ